MLKLANLKGDRGIWLVIILLGMISTLAVYSSTSALAFRFQSGNTEYYLLRHTVLLVIGFVVMYFVHLWDYRFFAKISKLMLYLSVILLVYTLFQGEQHEINRAARWITVFGQSFQPSDFAKFTLMVYLARILTEKQNNIKDFYKSFLPAIGWVLVLCGLVAPANLSTALLMFIASILLMFIAGVSKRHLFGLLMIGFLGLVVLMFTARRFETWRNRMVDFGERWTNSEYVPNYQTAQANIAIASGGFLGNGAGKSVQRNYIPHPYSDFVYAVIIEEYGLLGGIFVLGLYLMLLFRSVGIVTMSKTFGALLAAGLSFLLVIQAFINMGVTVGLLPVTGLPLPLISMGGTSIVFTGLALGVILSVSRHALERQENPDNLVPTM